jgi:hypothetical protein
MPKAAAQREYEIVGNVIKGRAQLEIEGQTMLLEPGNSWAVPQGALHRYTIYTILQPLQTFLKQRRLGLQKNRLDRFNRPAPVAEDHQRPLSSHGSASGTEFDPCQRSPAGNFKGLRYKA